MKLTVCMIARNEEATIAKALDSLHWADPHPSPLAQMNGDGLYPLWDELVVVLAGESTDNTEIIARSYGAVVGYYPAPDGVWPTTDDGKELRHYGDAREATERLATSDYVFWIDADERLVKGHELIRKIVEQGKLLGVRPQIKALNGVVQARQGLLHKRGRFKWRGAVHEWLEGMPLLVEPGILYEEIERPDGDRSHGDMFEILRKDMGDKLETHQLYYMAREHLAEKHFGEAIACARLFIEAGGGFPERRSQVQLFAGHAWMELGDLYQARLAFLEAVKEWGNWAEPYYALARVHQEMGMYREAIAWGSAACIFEPGEEVSDPSVYSWRRFDVMAYCLAAVGRYEQAAQYYQKVYEAHPNEATHTNLAKCRRFAEKV